MCRTHDRSLHRARSRLQARYFTGEMRARGTTRDPVRALTQRACPELLPEVSVVGRRGHDVGSPRLPRSPQPGTDWPTRAASSCAGCQTAAFTNDEQSASPSRRRRDDRCRRIRVPASRRHPHPLGRCISRPRRRRSRASSSYASASASTSNQSCFSSGSPTSRRRSQAGSPWWRVTPLRSPAPAQEPHSRN